MAALGDYRRLIAEPTFAYIELSSLVSRTAISMSTLSLALLILHRTHSYAVSGAVVAGYVIAGGLFGPLWARLVDRHGRRIVLAPTATVYALALALLTVAPARPVYFVAALALIAGASFPPVATVARAMFGDLLPAEETGAAFAFDSAAQEVCWVAGPSLVGVLAATAGPVSAVAVTAGLAFGGTMLFLAHPATAGGRTVRTHVGHVLAIPGMAVMVVVSGILIVAFSIVDVGVIGFATQHGASADAGWLLAIWSAGSLVGGLTVSAWAAARPHRILAPMVLIISLSFLSFSFAGQIAVLGALLLIGGYAVAPTLASLFTLVAELAPTGAVNEAFGWMTGAFQFGGAAGAALGGQLVQHVGPTAAFYGSTVIMTATGLWLWAYRGRLASARDSAIAQL